MYSFIVHPINRKKYPIHSNTAKYILKLYISNLLAGSDKYIEDKVIHALEDYVTQSIKQGYPGVYITPTKNKDGSVAPSWELLSELYNLEHLSRKKSSFRLKNFLQNNDSIFQIKFIGDEEKQSDKYITFSDTYVNKSKVDNLKKYLTSLKFNLINPHNEDDLYISEEDLENLINQDIDKDALYLCNEEDLKECGISGEKAKYIYNKIKSVRLPLYKRK